MKRTGRAAALVLAAVLLILAVLPALADFGNFSGSSGYSGGDSGDSDSIFGFLFELLFELIFRLIYRILGPVGTAVLVAVIVLWATVASTRKRKKRNAKLGRLREERGLRPVEELAAGLRDFKAAAVRDQCTALYRKMQEAWGKGDLTEIRDSFKPDAFAQYSRQLEEQLRRGETAHCSVHSVSAYPVGWTADEHEYHLTVEIDANITAWNTQETGRVVSGSDTEPVSMRYLWTLSRPVRESASLQYCPNCGHELRMNAAALCPACGAPIEAPGHGWLLASIQGISQEPG